MYVTVRSLLKKLTLFVQYYFSLSVAILRLILMVMNIYNSVCAPIIIISMLKSILRVTMKVITSEKEEKLQIEMF